MSAPTSRQPDGMTAVVVREIGSFSIEERSVPSPGPAEVLVRVTVTGLCRTDLKLIRVGHRDLVLPRVPGEEVVGIVESAGEDVAPSLVGQRVYVYPGDWCGCCAPCRSGAGNLCRSMRIMGFHRDGGFAGYVVVPVKCLIPIPEGLTDETAVFAEPLSCCLNALELARLSAGERIAIWGAGPAGTLLSRAAEARGAEVVVIETDDRRRERAGGVATPPDDLFDVCVPAVGSPDAYEEALARLGPRGRLVVFSGLPHDAAVMPVDLNALHYHEQTVVGAYGCSYHHSVAAIDLLSSGRVSVGDLVSHRMPLTSLDEALDLVARRDCMKIHLYPA